MLNSFVIVNSDHGAMIVSQLDYNTTPEGNMYGVGAQIMHQGQYEKQEIENIKQMLELRRQHYGDGLVVLDCGANIGVHTVEFARQMRGWGHVISIEAQPRIYYALCGNIALQNAWNAQAINAAVGDEQGMMDVDLPDYTKHGSFGSLELGCHGEDIGQSLGSLKTKIMTITIDGFNLPRCDLIKLDVEGMELEAIEGARKTIERCQPILVIEHIKIDRDHLAELLDGFGYESQQFGMNTFAVPRKVAVSLVEKASKLVEDGKTNEGLEILNKVVADCPDYQEARINRGFALMQSMRMTEAIEDFNHLLSGQGCGDYNAIVRFSKGFANLVLGNLKAGFVDFEYRKTSGLVIPPKLEWDGVSSLAGKTVHVVGEMGYGDNIMFARYIPMLQVRDAKVVVSVPASQQSLMRCIPGVDDVSSDADLPKCDYRIRMMSLAYVFGTDIDTVPLPAWFVLPIKHANQWQAGLSSEKLRVGLCWAGSKDSFYDKHRTIPLEKMAPLFQVPGVEFYSLMLDIRDSDVDAFDRLPLVDVGRKVKTFLDTACVIAGLDLVITVDTSIAHLAGSLGVPTWVLLTSFRTYWLWIKDRTDCPWYPSAEAIRQKNDGDWDEVIKSVAEKLQKLTIHR